MLICCIKNIAYLNLKCYNAYYETQLKGGILNYGTKYSYNK